jgi:C1A family cysteine protease
MENKITVDGKTYNLAWKSRKEYYAKSPTLLPHKFETHEEKFKALNKVAAKTSYRVKNEQIVPIYDQADEGSCTGNALCASAMIINAVNGDPVVVLSRQFNYYNARFAQGQVNIDSGSDSATVIAMALTYGLPRESTFPYGPETFIVNGAAVVPPLAAYVEASNNKSYQWFEITGSGSKRLDAIEAAIQADFPVIFGTSVDNSIFSYQPGQVMGPPTGRIIGGHELTIVAVEFDDKGNRSWLVRNSWGDSWGDKGYFKINDEWLGDAFLIDGVDFLSKADAIIF